jgi:hypothetical protein
MLTDGGRTRMVGLVATNCTVTPPAGAGDSRVMMHWVIEPPLIDDGLNRRPRIPIGRICRLAFAVSDPVVAVIVALTIEVTLLVETVNVLDVDPAGMVTLGGTVAAAWLLLSVTIVPPGGAGAPRVTVPIEF